MAGRPLRWGATPPEQQQTARSPASGIGQISTAQTGTIFYYVGADQHIYEIGWNMGVGSYETADVTAESHSPLATSERP